jgi:hypothetical protein
MRMCGKTEKRTTKEAEMKEPGEQTGRPEKKWNFFNGSNFLGLNFYLMEVTR